MRSFATAFNITSEPAPAYGDLRVAIAHDHRSPADKELAGGDVIAFDRHDDGSTTLLMADVSAQGDEGAQYAEWLASVFHLTCTFITRPSSILEQLNVMLSDASSVSDAGLSARAFVCRLFPQDSYFVYSTAGAEPPILLKGGSHCVTLASGGLPLGKSEKSAFADSALPVDANDTLIAFTDGLTESHRPSSSRKLGVNGVIKAIQSSIDVHAGLCASDILRQADTFNTGFYCDDATLVVASFLGAR